MALKKEQVYRSFIKGLMTEASPLTFPADTSLDEDNFVLNRDGSRERRLGVDYESGYTLTSTGFSTAELSSGRQSFHSWSTASGSASRSIGVVRILNKLWFLDMLTDSPSSNLLNGGSPIEITGLNRAAIETAVINTNLVIVSSDLSNPVMLSYDTDTDTISQETVSIKIRDIWGINDTLEIDNRPTTLTSLHTYNLRNQGWSKNITTDSADEAIKNYYSDMSRYPSNADNWVLGRNSNPTSGDYEKFQGYRMARNSIGNSPAPKGALVIDAFNRGASRTTEANKAGQNKNTTNFVSNVSGLPIDRETGNISTVASFSGRLFYSGVNSEITDPDDRSPNYSNYVFFSQVVTNNTKLGRCYQDADPTSATINDLIDSDGGTIAVPDCTQIIKVAASKASLIIFGDNGVWELYGGSGGFVATSFQIAKVSTVGIYTPNAVLTVGNAFIYWTKAGIYSLEPDSVSGRYTATNISISTIQSYFLEIPELAKANIRSFYDEKQNKCRWLFNDSDTYSESNYITSYNKELVFDMTLKAFYKNSISSLDSNSPLITSYVEIPGFSLATQSTDVLSGTDTVLVSTDIVIVDETTSVAKNSQFSFLTLVGTSFTLATYKNPAFVDWQIAGSGTGADFSSYLVTGYELFEDLMREKTVPYIVFYFHRSEDGYQLNELSEIVLKNQSSCLVQAQWNWANSAASGRWGTQFQAYRLLRPYVPENVNDPFDYGESVIVTKHKLRGTGKCLSLKLQSESGKAMHLLGWGISANATTSV